MSKNHSICRIVRQIALCAIHFFSEFLDFRVVDVVFVGHEFINLAIRCQFNDAVGDGVDKLMVVTGKEDVALEQFEVSDPRSADEVVQA